ncbi:MAG: hypothetical protein QF599_12750 [Planctomycetota bacterium]|nr:hypothetical protein [Planctomycetota bacterium]MDP6956832.1 hypothetical protein [Planctomycetota bacterium]
MSLIRIIAPCVLGPLFLAPSLSTDYTQRRSLRIEVETGLEMETTSFEMSIDGEPVERGGMGGQASEEVRMITVIDTVLADDDGRPTEVRREFETVEKESIRTMGEEDMVDEASGPLAGVTVLLVSEDGGEVETEVEAGSVDDDELLEGLRLELAFDAFLPEGELEVDDSWDLEADAVLRALGLDLESALFPRESGGGMEGEGRRRGGRGSSAFGLLVEADWEGTATLESMEEEYNGLICVLIELELEASGEREERMMGGGRYGRGGVFGGALVAAAPVESTYDIELEGRLLFCLEEGRPVLLEIEGDVATERSMERSSERGDFSMRSTQEGSFTYTASLSLEESEG